MRLGDEPGGTADLEELKDSIADELQEQFGDYEDTGTLIDHAVKVLQRDAGVQQLELTPTPTTTTTTTLLLTRCCRRAWRRFMKSRWPRLHKPLAQWSRVIRTRLALCTIFAVVHKANRHATRRRRSYERSSPPGWCRRRDGVTAT